MNETINIIKSRKSIRVYTDREITAEEKRLILESAINAPTAGNQQLYTIIDVTDEALKNKLVKSCDNQSFIADAKMVLIFCADCKKWYDGYIDAGCTPRKPGVGDLLLAVSDTNIAAQNAVIAAESLGIGSCYIGDIMENCETQRELLGLPEYVFPAAMIVFGFPTEQQIAHEKPKRAPIEVVVSENAYPAMDEAYREKLFGYKAADGDYKRWMKMFHDRKYNSDFAVEMTRSVHEFLKQYQ